MVWDAFGSVVSAFDAQGLRAQLTYPNSRTLNFTHDELHRLTGVADAGAATALAQYTYKGYYLNQCDLSNSAVRLSFTNTNALDGYDAFGRIAWMRHYQVTGGADIAKFAYGRDGECRHVCQENQRVRRRRLKAVRSEAIMLF